MEFDGELLLLDSRDADDRLLISDLVLAFGRTLYGDPYPGGTYPELVKLNSRIVAASPRHLIDRRPRPVLTLDIDEIQVCAGLINAAIRTHDRASLPVESMEQTRDTLYGLLDRGADGPSIL